MRHGAHGYVSQAAVLLSSVHLVASLPTTYQEAPDVADHYDCLDNQGWCRCTTGKMLTGLYKGYCDDLHCLEQYHCARPVGSTGVGSCVVTSVDAALNDNGTGGKAVCPAGKMLNGIYRATCDSLSCIDQFECCEFTHPDGTYEYGAEVSADWDTCFDSQGIWCDVPTDTYMVGISRGATPNDLTAIDLGWYRELVFIPRTDAPDTPAPDTPAPPTPAPPTLAPPTGAPPTSSPPTQAPPTPAPPTPAPPTSAPPTQAPDTPAPPTPAPPTSAPPTAAPPTPAPPTQAPPTAAPPTPAPPTQAPPTPAPPTPAPPTLAPPTPAPPTLAPPTPAPPTLAPPTPAPPTSAPPTPAPPTPAPPTQAPPTPAPPTWAPLTPAPPTPAPDTPAPATPAPKTPAPGTPSPPTPAPATLAPLTPAPPTPAPATTAPPTFPPPTAAPDTAAAPTTAPGTPAPEFDKKETISTIGGVTAGAASLGAAGSAAAATRLVLIADACPKNGVKRKFPFPLHPTGISIQGSEAAGAVIGNFSIAIGFTLLMRVALEVFRKGGKQCFPAMFEGLDTQGWLRFPSVSLFIFQWLYQGTTLGSMILLMYPGNALQFILGLASLAVCVVVPLLVFRVVVRDVGRKAVYSIDTVKKGRLYVALCGPGEWVSVGSDVHWVNRFASVMRSYTQRAAWFTVIEFAGSFSLAALGTLNTESWVGCGHVKVAMCMVFATMAGLEGALWPHARAKDNIADFILLGTEGAALLLMAGGFYKEKDIGDDQLHDIAERLFLVSGVFLLVKAVTDLLTEAFILVTGRRARLQADAWGIGRDKEEALVACSDLGEDSELEMSAVQDTQQPTSSASPLSTKPHTGSTPYSLTAISNSTGNTASFNSHQAAAKRELALMKSAKI